MRPFWLRQGLMVGVGVWLGGGVGEAVGGIDCVVAGLAVEVAVWVGT